MATALPDRQAGPRSDEAERENNRNPKGYNQFLKSLCHFGLGVSLRIHLRPCFLSFYKID